MVGSVNNGMSQEREKLANKLANQWNDDQNLKHPSYRKYVSSLPNNKYPHFHKHKDLDLALRALFVQQIKSSIVSQLSDNEVLLLNLEGNIQNNAIPPTDLERWAEKDFLITVDEVNENQKNLLLSKILPRELLAQLKDTQNENPSDFSDRFFPICKAHRAALQKLEKIHKICRPKLEMALTNRIRKIDWAAYIQ
jgi:hypothetical protein